MATAEQSEAISPEREYISPERFAKYLLLESNDAYDPDRTCPLHSGMTEPLNNYWVNTSHDTYLRRTTTSSTDQKDAGKTDLQSYTLALYRGARAIELDVWDGATGTTEPVVRCGVTSFDDTAAGKAASNYSSLVFRDVLKSVSYFLQSKPDSYPVILLIENQ